MSAWSLKADRAADVVWQRYVPEPGIGREDKMHYLRNLVLVAAMAISTAAAIDAATAEQVIGKFTFKGGDGLTVDKAIIVDGIGDTKDMLNAIDVWVKQNKPGWQVMRLRLTELAQHAGLLFAVQIEKANEAPIVLYFIGQH
jgi:hypothetical protein